MSQANLIKYLIIRKSTIKKSQKCVNTGGYNKWEILARNALRRGLGHQLSL